MDISVLSKTVNIFFILVDMTWPVEDHNSWDKDCCYVT